MASTTIGLDPNRVTPNPEFGINSFGEQSDKAFVYVKINGAVGEAGEVIVIANDGLAHPITTSFDLIGRRVGIAPSAAAIGTYCWLLVRGESRFLVAANCDAHSSLRATTVGGVVDDFGSGPVIEGLFSTENNGAMQGLVSGRLVHPTLQEQGAGGGGGGASTFLDLADTPAAFGTVGQVAKVNTAEDAIIFEDESGGGGSFDLHDDVTTALTAISGTDRFVLSDESASGDPNRYITHSQLLNGIRDIFTANNAAPAATDRFYCSDESASGDPIEYLTFAQLEAAIQPDASEVDVDTANFSQNLTSSDDTVQAALETIDSFSQYQGTWQQASWPAGVIVARSGIAYISLVNNNTEIPTPASTQWAGLTEGFTYRGEAPVVATNYNYGHVVKNPDTGSYYYFISTISASVARADIATHANFQVIGGETGHAPSVDSGDTFPTAPVANDIFFFNADVASGLDWKDTNGTTDLTAATAGDMAIYDGTDWIKVINLVGGGGVGTDDQNASEVDVDATGFATNLGSGDTDVQTALETIDALALGGGGGGGEAFQRVDSLVFTAVASTTTQDRQQTLAATGFLVEDYESGGESPVTAVASATTFTMKAGVYLIEWAAIVTNSGQRAAPTLDVQDDADDSVIGSVEFHYIRYANTAVRYTFMGLLVVAADDTVCKAIVYNKTEDEAFTVAAGHTLRIASLAGGRQ